MRSMLSAERSEKSNSPLAGPLASTPSMRTSVWPPLAPRRRTCVKPVTPLVRLTSTPGRLRSASAALRTCCSFNCSPLITVTEEPMRSRGVPSPPPAGEPPSAAPAEVGCACPSPPCAGEAAEPPDCPAGAFALRFALAAGSASSSPSVAIAALLDRGCVNSSVAPFTTTAGSSAAAGVAAACCADAPWEAASHAAEVASNTADRRPLVSEGSVLDVVIETPVAWTVGETPVETAHQSKRRGPLTLCALAQGNRVRSSTCH